MANRTWTLKVSVGEEHDDGSAFTEAVMDQTARLARALHSSGVTAEVELTDTYGEAVLSL